ncbi:asparagine synthase (glutamine-hydrolyzing) [Bacillota bacterium LX-D]|nr:asparagine synthase (glutamine-hydrolyzing) [Bacillota bacterium LX-D]
MCGIAGWINLKENISTECAVINKMADTLNKRGPDQSGSYYSEHAVFGHKRLVVIDPQGGSQPMVRTFNGKKYVIVYNGELYNTEELRKELLQKGFRFQAYSDTEVLLLSYIYWGEECLKYLNGIFAFAIWNETEESLFMARDPLGVKPLFYTTTANSLIFGSEIKALLAHPQVKTVITEEGLTELLSLGPARSLGSGIFANIREIPPAYWAVYNSHGLQLHQYWQLNCYEHKEDLGTTAEHIRYLLVDAIERQLVSDVPLCTFLSGGLDSSAISAVAAAKFKEQGKVLSTYSLEYEDNQAYYQPNEFEPTSDAEWAWVMARSIGSNHQSVVLNNYDVAAALEAAVRAHDLPGMADIDSSLYLFCREIRKKNTVSVSGECADEIFGGYPWYRRSEDLNCNTFPWSKSINERKQLLHKSLQKIDLEGCVQEQYAKTLAQVPVLPSDSPQEQQMKKLFYLNLKWFMITLLNRKDRMSMANSLEVRVPFADYRLVEYAFNLPSELKFHGGREKGLLRLALQGILPPEIITRKKSPYPKTHHPKYTEAVQKRLLQILANPSSPILELIDKEYVTKLAETGGAVYSKPWYGQLMRGPQLLAYLIQLNFWLEEYNVTIKLT